MTNFPKATIQSPPNPELRWERVAIFNTGIDFESKNRRISGSLEYFKKKGTEQIGNIPLDPTSGFFLANRYSTSRNGAEISGSGVDAELMTRNTVSALKWETNILFSFSSDKVTSYSYEHPLTSYLIGAPPLVGKPVTAVYSYRWAGLDPLTGDPMVFINGIPSKDYSAMNSRRSMDDLVYHGSVLPRITGGFRNTVLWKGWSAGINLTYKFDYYFRRSSISYNSLYSSWIGHKDFSKRWQKPGDEALTNVPSMPTGINNNRDPYYLNSDILIEEGDHIRLRDITLTYTPDLSQFKRLPIRKLSFTLYAYNPGILWRANKAGIDPDYSSSSVLPVRTISMGLKTHF